MHLAGGGWRENKNACLIRALRTATGDSDPQPEPPSCFCDPQHLAKIAETEALFVAAPPGPRRVEAADDPPASSHDGRPKRLVRTVLSSLADARAFGKQMVGEAKLRRFFEASAKALLGDGLPSNRSIWKRHFRDFTPILDFIHALSYAYAAATPVHAKADDVWDQYLAFPWTHGAGSR